MCNPQAALAMQAAGSINQTVGAYYSARAQRSTLRFEADMADRQAGQVIRAGQREEQRTRLATAQIKGRQRAAIARGGVDLGEGTAAQVLTSTDVLGEIDADTVRANAVASAWGYRTDAINKRAAASTISPGMSALTTALGSGQQVASSWYRLNQAGAKV
jgi:hypothetical protein